MMGSAASSAGPTPASPDTTQHDPDPDPDGRLPLLQRLQHAISRGDLAGLIAAVDAADAAAGLQQGPPTLSRHLLFSAVRAGHAPVVGWLLSRHEAQHRQQQQQQAAPSLVDNRGE